jgi:6-methylsalicylate decarboxylase
VVNTALFLWATPGTTFLADAASAAALARDLNDYTADLVSSSAGGFGFSIALETGRTPDETLPLFSSFYFDTALSSSPAALPSLLAFADPDHITFGSDWPFAPVAVGKIFADHLEGYPGLDAAALRAIDCDNALALFPRLGASDNGG